MKTEGPPLETLLRRLEDCPPDFLAEPRIGQGGDVCVEALVADLLRDWGAPPDGARIAAALQSGAPRARRNELKLVLLGCWLLRDPCFQRPGSQAAAAAAEWLLRGVRDLARYAPAPQFVADPDRREELARLTLAALGLRPAGETPEQAEDRARTLNSAERQRVIAAAQAAEKRSRELREELARKAANEAADKWNRE